MLVVAAVCGAGIWGVAYYRSRQLSTPQDALRYVPAGDAALLYIDFAALRSSGILQMLLSSRVAEEPEYTAFVRKTDFDYKQDLDSALVAFTPKSKYFLARGRFDWSRLKAYVKDEDGSCYNSVCEMAGSTPQRKISFMPLRRDLLALAVAPDERAVMDLMQPAAKPAFVPPEAPVWLSMPGALLRSADTFPEGTRAFARSMAQADRITLSLGPQGQRFELRANIVCRSDAEAIALAAQLENTTAALRQMIAREHQVPNPRDLSGVLTGGSFRHDGPRVLGSWPVERAFLQEIAGGTS